LLARHGFAGNPDGFQEGVTPPAAIGDAPEGFEEEAKSATETVLEYVQTCPASGLLASFTSSSNRIAVN
jgi:hypothetical protein